MQNTLNTLIATLKAAMTAAPGSNTVTVTALGTFVINLPQGSGTVLSGTCTITGSPVALVAGNNTITTTGMTGTITVITTAGGTLTNGAAPGGGTATGSPITLVTPETVYDYFVRTFYSGDPLALPSIETPACAVIPSQPSPREAVFVGMDTVTETFKIRFYQPATRKVAEAVEVAAGMTRLIAMFEKASLVLRTDPTFGSVFVSSKIINIEPLLSGVADANAYRACEITFQVTNRALWGS